MKTIKQLYPPYLLAMILYVQAALLLINFHIFNARELLIYLSWIPLLMLPYFFTKKKFVYIIVISLFFLEGLINLSHILVIKAPINASSLFVLMNTNINEAKEFINLKFHFTWLLVIPYIFIYYLALKHPPTIAKQKGSIYIVAAVLLFSVIFISENLINNRLIRKGIPQTAKAIISFNNEMKTYKALKLREVSNVEVKLKTAEQYPHVFVLIIGESCNRNHMSLYNYYRKTTPHLDNRKDIVVYTDVVSPYSNTIGSLLTALTESNLDNKKDYDKSISLIDIFHSLGYKTFWLSNQAPIGVWDNAIYNLAKTSDICVFVNNAANTSFESTYLLTYDEKLFKPFQNSLSDTAKNKFIVIHLMGSHSKYAKRYPQKFNKFNFANNNKGKIINEYDNSILYNDFVVDSLLNILKSYCKNNSTVISTAIYFSDHGENVYDENDNVGHDYADDLPKNNVEIPFIVWCSPQFQSLYPDKYKTALSNKEKPFVTDDLFHAIIDLNDVDFYVFEAERSIFNESYNANRKRILEDNKDYDSKAKYIR
jgi:heptose-I-phosphate ethanolaminephosphotransferase